MRKVKTFLSTVSLLVALTPFANVSFAASKICDNDPATSGCTGTPFGTWSKRSGGYSGDFRIQFQANQSGSASRYLYGLSSGLTSSRTLAYWAYLGTADATCQNANYSTISGYLTEVNQNTAPSGWNLLGSDTDSGTVPLSVYAYGTNGDLVADAVQISW